MIENNQESDKNLNHLEMIYKENKYRFVPTSNYWICVESEDWTQRWVIASDEFGLELTAEAKERGHDISQLLIDNKCSRRRTNIKKKKENNTESFFSLFDEEVDNSKDDDDGFVSLF